ncbi:hypothetical protein BJ741DRAFT_598035 [Chytriomyces cf. hyalinus JEL632]|nr:hypothetical protein BJ741DRAFT_598035 [Chytriomyces cf. hyalinus JEL632]
MGHTNTGNRGAAMNKTNGNASTDTIASLGGKLSIPGCSCLLGPFGDSRNAHSTASHWVVCSHIDWKSDAFGNDTLDRVLTQILNTSNCRLIRYVFFISERWSWETETDWFTDASAPRKVMGAIRESDSFTGVDAIVCIGGDALLHEILNGLLTRCDWPIAIQTPIVVIPLDSVPTSPHIYQTSDMAIQSLLLATRSQSPQTNVISKCPIMACTTMSGLRVFSHASVRANISRFIEFDAEPSSTSLFQRLRQWLTMQPEEEKHSFNLALLETLDSSSNVPTPEPDKSSHRGRSALRPDAKSLSSSDRKSPNQKTLNSSRPITKIDSSPPRIAPPCGPQLRHFESICKNVLSNTPAPAALPCEDLPPLSVTSLPPLNSAFEHQPQNPWKNALVEPNGQDAFVCTLSVDDSGEDVNESKDKGEIVSASLTVQGNGIPSALSHESTLSPETNVSQMKHSKTQALCLFAPKVYQPGVRVDSLIVDGVEFHERRGVSVEVVVSGGGVEGGTDVPVCFSIVRADGVRGRNTGHASDLRKLSTNETGGRAEKPRDGSRASVGLPSGICSLWVVAGIVVAGVAVGSRLLSR